MSQREMSQEEKDRLISEIQRLKKEKQALILAHYYQMCEIQEVADEVGDSLALAQKAAKADNPLIVMCGVHFMGETAKILCPGKKVLVPDATAGCSLADSCDADEFAEFTAAHPDHTVISYVNTTAAVKALTDVVVTSGNAVRIVESFPKDEKIIFGPDRNLGSYINAITGRDMLLWDGACHVHEQFSAEGIRELKKAHPRAEVLVHPECPREIREMADKVGSTAVLLKYSVEESAAEEFIVVTESGILHKMRQGAPTKTFIPAPVVEGSERCNCSKCKYMQQNTLEKLYLCLRDETPEVVVDPLVAERARRPIERMLELS